MERPKKLSRSERSKMIQTLKVDTEIAGTFPVYGEGDDQTVAYSVIKVTPTEGYDRGALFRVPKKGDKQEIISAHEQGEPINFGNYEHQRDLAIRYARQEGVGYGELDHKFSAEVMGERRKMLQKKVDHAHKLRELRKLI